MHEVKIVFNVLCNKRIRILRLKSLIEQLTLMNTRFISIRLRGEFAKEAKQLLEVVFRKENFELYRIRIGDTYKQWKMNTLEQIIFDGPETDYIGVFQEDFLFTSPTEIVECYVEQAILLCEEAIELLPGPYYGMAAPADASELRNKREKYVISLHLNRMNILKTGRVVHSLTSWPAIYKRELVMKALISNRPFLKKFHPDYPFDWEKSTRAKWLLPIRWCSPRFELLACIDYDSLWPGSSLQSRGLENDNIIREDDTLDPVARKTIDLIQKINRVTFKLIGKGNLERFSKFTALKHNIKRLNIYLNAMRYTCISLIFVPLRLDEKRLKRKAKSLLGKRITQIT